MPTLELSDVDTAEPTASRRAVPLEPSLRPRILSVSPALEDHADLRRILDPSVWEVLAANSLAEALPLLQQERIILAICERTLPDGSWRGLVEPASAAPSPCLIVVSSRLADDQLWMEVLGQGAFDLLAKPFDEPQVLHVVSAAWNHDVPPGSHHHSAGTM
jgi:DNA-binding response OmpR family regulator